MTALEVCDLHVTFPGRPGTGGGGHTGIPAVRGVALSIEPGETVALVGESGSGKSALAGAVTGLLPAGTRTSGLVRLGGRPVTGLGEPAWRDLRGRVVGVVPQEPMAALHPTYPVVHQVSLAVRAHRRCGRREALRRAVTALEDVGITAAEAARLPHELSGGQRQRVVVAAALVHRPVLVVADEPTTALDPLLRDQVVDVLTDGVRASHSALLLVSHDLGMVAGVADRVAVMRSGELLEYGATDAVLTSPAHPWTRRLLDARPGLSTRGRRLDAGLTRLPDAGAEALVTPGGGAGV